MTTDLGGSDGSPPASRWEVGSHFALASWNPVPARASTNAWDALFATARGALAGILQTGVAQLGWKVLYVPSYYCGPAYPAGETPIEIRSYDSTPRGSSLPVRTARGAALLAVSYYGQPPPEVPDGPELILDLTHDPWAPWAVDLHPAYRFASLRKTLPVACGGGIAARGDVPVPVPRRLTPGGQHLIAQRIDAMTRKAAYLRGDLLDRASFVQDLARSELGFSSLGRQAADVATARALATMPVDAWRSARRVNVATLASAIRPDRSLDVVETPFAVVLLLRDRIDRDSLRSWLIANRVFPAVLWEQDHRFADAEGRDFADRHLVLGADFRYDRADMLRVAALVNDWRDRP